MANIRIISSFTKSERQRMAVISDIYRECVSSELPHELRLDKKKPVHKADVRDWVPETWINQMGKGILKPNCEALVVQICEYQVDRSNRYFGSGYRDDPYVLFLEELKSWITKTVSYIDCNLDARKILRDRIRYLEHILAEPNLFDPFPTHKMTMQQVVFHSRKILLYEMLPIVEAEIAHSSAREDIRQLQKSVRSALDQLVKFLYHVFRDGGGPLNITISKLRQPSGEKYTKVLNNSSGSLIHNMVSSGLFTSIFKDDHFYFEEETKKISEGMAVGKPEVVQSNEYLDSRGNVKLPGSLLQFIEPEDLKKRATVNLQNCFDHESSGFESFFRGNGMISATYLRCYGLCQELAKFVLVCEKAHRLAGQGGDLLVYGVANAQVNAIMSTYDQLTKALRSTVDRINQIAEIRFEKLVNQNLARESANSWVKHFKKISYILEQFRGDLDIADTAANHIRVQANSLTLSERLQKAKEETENFVIQAEGYSRHVAGVLGVEYTPPKLPSMVRTNEALEGNDYNAFNDRPNISKPLMQSITQSSSPYSSPLMITSGDQTLSFGKQQQQQYQYQQQQQYMNGSPSNSPITALHQMPPSTAMAILNKMSSSPIRQNDNEEELIMVKEGITSATLNRVFIRLTPNVVRLSLENNKIGGDGALALFEHVAKYCPGIKSINLYHNDLGVEGARALAACITRPYHSLQKLDLNSNDIGDEGAMYIIGGLGANRTLTHLDLGFNGITDEGIADLTSIIQSPDCVLKFLQLAGNKLTPKSLIPIVEIFEANPNIVSIDIGDTNERLPPNLVERFRNIAHPRKRAHNEKLRLDFEAEMKKAAQAGRIRQIEAAPMNPLGPILKPVPVRQKVEKSDKIIEKQKADKMKMIAVTNPSPKKEIIPANNSNKVTVTEPTDSELPQDEHMSSVYTTSSGSSIVIEDLGDVVYQEEEDEPEPELQVTDFYAIIRILQNLLPVSKNKESGCVKKSVVKKALECGAYGASVPIVTMTFEEYYEAARAAGVLEVREIKKKGSPSKIGMALTDVWRSYKVPPPDTISKITANAWKLFILACKAKPNVAHKKKSSLLAWAKATKPELMKMSEDVLNAMIELSIYSGTLIKDVSSGKYQSNLSQKRYPIDKSVCPQFEM